MDDPHGSPAQGSVEEHSVYTDLLLSQLNSFEQGFWKSEELGDKRVNFFVTLIAATLAATVALAGSAHVQLTPYLVTLGMFAIFVFGIYTWRRMLRRDETTDEHKKAIEYVRRELARFDSQIKHFDPFPDDPNEKLDWWSKLKISALARCRILKSTSDEDIHGIRPWRGGLVSTVGLANSIIVASMFAVWVDSEILQCVVAGLVFVLSLGTFSFSETLMRIRMKDSQTRKWNRTE